MKISNALFSKIMVKMFHFKNLVRKNELIFCLTNLVLFSSRSVVACTLSIYIVIL